MERRGIVLRDHATEREPGERVGCRESRVKVLGPDVVKIYIDSVGSRLKQGPGQVVRGFIIDDMSNTDALDIPAFFGPPCRSDNCVPLDLGDLTHDRTYGAGC